MHITKAKPGQARRSLALSRLILLTGGILMACSGNTASRSAPPDESEPLASIPLPLTDVIPNSTQCNLGHGPMRCIYAPLLNSSTRLGPAKKPPKSSPFSIPNQISTSRMILDGIRDEKEWSGSIQLAYNHETGRANDGKIYLILNQIGKTVSAWLFFENFPIDSRAAPEDRGVVRVYLDHDRFRGKDIWIGPEDRLFEFDIVNGIHLQNYSGSDTHKWIKEKKKELAIAVAGKHCKEDPSTPSILRCNAEVHIPLNPSALVDPDPENTTISPGFGLAITDGSHDPSNGINSYPQGLNGTGIDSRARARDRTQWETILIGRPKGFPLKIMSWNIRRFKSDLFKGEFSSVTNKDIGKFLALNDVVAIQEGWDTQSVFEIWKEANLVRTAHGLPPFQTPYGPPHFTFSEWLGVTERISEEVLGEPETQGGLWIFSHLPAKQTGQYVFQPNGNKAYCQGEDCLRAKGVQWVRLNLNPSDGPGTDCNHPEKSGSRKRPIEKPNHCQYSPSGDHYVDIFNTHLQAGNTTVCKDLTYSDKIKEELDSYLGTLVGTPVSWLESGIEALMEYSFFCDTPTKTIREEQLRQFNDYIEATAIERDRPAILLGDFNLDGKTITDGNSYDVANEYIPMMKALKIGRVSEGIPQPGDTINPWPDDFSYDYDYGDVARERPNFRFADPFGTFLTSTGGFFVTGQEEQDKDKWKQQQAIELAEDIGYVRGNERYDFILIRPPYSPDSSQFKQAKWIALKPSNPREVWSSPWPGLEPITPVATSGVPAPPQRLSDHKPVISTIELAPLAQPPVYHPDWKHTWEYRITSVDASGIGDCIPGADWLFEDCIHVDPYFAMSSGKVILDGSNTKDVPLESKGKQQTGVCDEQSVAQWSKDACTSGWFLQGKHENPLQISHEGAAILMDDETYTDKIQVVPKKGNVERSPYVKTIWNSTTVQNRAEIRFLMDESGKESLQWESWASTVFPEDSAPIGACTPYKNNPKEVEASVCVQIHFEELPPGQQFKN